MKVAIIGSGISGILVAKTFLEANYEVYLYDASNLRKKNLNKKKLSFFPQTEKTPFYPRSPLSFNIVPCMTPISLSINIS